MFSFVLFLIFFVIASFLFFTNRKWWIKIDSKIPQCTYYFGPFDSLEEAESDLPGYLQDLEAEEAKGLTILIERCQPRQLTIPE
ncbi:MAG: DUF1816 domain-containing protein [Microcystaceae cyanobacterium]